MVKTLALRPVRAVLIALAALAVAVGVDHCENWIGTASASALVVRTMAWRAPAADHQLTVTGCRYSYGFVWHNANPGYLGLTRVNVHSITSVGGASCGRAQVRAIMVCIYLGPRAAHVNRTYTGNIVHLGVTQVNCRRFSIAPGWTLLTGRAGGLQFRNVPTIGWSTHFVVG